jgi:menaquinone-specific isochorismate synthase
VPTAILAPPRSVSSPARERLARALQEAARTWDGRAPLRVEVPAPPVDALDWLRAQTLPDHAYWHGRSEVEARAAVGAALDLRADTLDDLPPTVTDALGALPPGARLYATARFGPEQAVADEWAAFGRVRFVLPRIDLRTDGRDATLAVTLAPGEPLDAALADLAALRPPTAGAAEVPPPRERQDTPDRAAWAGMIGWALGAFARGDLGKVVLARRVRFLFEQRIDPYALLGLLEAATPRCFHLLVAPGDGARAFVSASPERLFRLDGRTLQTEAVAGTRPRADLDADDDRLRDELLASEKDQREHAYVRHAITERLAPLTTGLTADAEASAMTLARGRHLYTGIRATLAPGATALDVLRALHPTPAVGGTPRAAAAAAIDTLEPFDRGLYAGPVGWIGRDAAGREQAEFAVGIRSGLVCGSALALYSGAGIVQGSTPDDEWAEIEHKIGDFARLLGLDARLAA